ncbi:YbjQ family protein [bacterium]|nr:YbjQ family protein [bacterium]
MLITTTDSIEGQAIEKYLGIVTGEAVFGVGVFADLKAGFSDLVGGRVESYEKELENSKNNALVEMIKEAKILGAHAIVGVDIDYLEFLGKYFMVVVNGTAVILKGFDEGGFPDNFVMPLDLKKPAD